jgi:hypothetical protein
VSAWRPTSDGRKVYDRGRCPDLAALGWQARIHRDHLRACSWILTKLALYGDTYENYRRAQTRTTGKDWSGGGSGAAGYGTVGAGGGSGMRGTRHAVGVGGRGGPREWRDMDQVINLAFKSRIKFPCPKCVMIGPMPP